MVDKNLETYSIALKALGLNALPDYMVELLYSAALLANAEKLDIAQIKILHDTIYKKHVIDRIDKVVEHIDSLGIDNSTKLAHDISILLLNGTLDAEG